MTAKHKAILEQRGTYDHLKPDLKLTLTFGKSALWFKIFNFTKNTYFDTNNISIRPCAHSRQLRTDFGKL